MTIFRIIAIVVILSVNGMTGRASPHIKKEVLETDPPQANSYTSAAIAGKVFVLGVVAAFSHAHPCSIFTGFAFPVRTIGFSIFAARFAVPAATRFRIALPQAVGQCRNLIAAVTEATPQWPSIFSTGHSNNGQSRVSMSRDVNQLHSNPFFSNV